MRQSKPKKRVQEIIEPPLPGTSLLFQNQIGNSKKKYEGTYIGFAVWIKDNTQASDLFSSGFYGKGILSRSKPTWHSDHSNINNNNSTSSSKRDGGFHRKRQQQPKKRKTIASNQANDPSSNSSTLPTSSKDGIDASLIKSEPELSAMDLEMEEQLKAQRLELESSVIEYLQLGLEEAFFLQHAIGCLTIRDEDGKELSDEQTWTLFNDSQPRFDVSYVSYHHYRSKGWTPKYGIKYGVDWVLYRKGPTFYHAEKAVSVITVNKETKDIDKEVPQRKLSWLNLLNQNRVSEQVKKGLVLCYIHKPSGVRPQDVNFFDWISLYQASELKVSRWLPSKTREE